MPKTEVLLIHNVIGLGGESDLVKISTGYARNYLIPQGLAVPVSLGNKRRVEALRQRRADRETKELSSMSELGKSLSKVTLTVSVKTGDDGKMFGSVTSGSIADALKTQLEVSLDKRKINLEKPIQAVGEYEIELRLHAEVHATFKLIVKSANPLPEPVAAPVADISKTEKRSYRGGPRSGGDSK
jgi:large subunit ribosomal protein L9